MRCWRRLSVRFGWKADANRGASVPLRSRQHVRRKPWLAQGRRPQAQRDHLTSRRFSSDVRKIAQVGGTALLGAATHPDQPVLPELASSNSVRRASRGPPWPRRQSYPAARRFPFSSRRPDACRGGSSFPARLPLARPHGQAAPPPATREMRVGGQCEMFGSGRARRPALASCPSWFLDGTLRRFGAALGPV